MSTQRKLRILVATAVLFCLGCSTTTKDGSTPYVKSTFPIRIVSANDGDANQSPGLERRDSITVIDLSPDAPPQTRTVSGTVPNTFNGAPSSAIISEGRYAVIPNHSWGQSGESSRLPSQITVVDLDSTDLKTVATLSLPEHTWQVAAHPDGDKVIVISGHHLYLIEFDSGIPRIAAKSEMFPLSFISFALSPDGSSIIVAAADEISYSTAVELHLFRLEEGEIRHMRQIEIDPAVGKIDQPFAPRFSPDGSRVLVLNGLGLAGRPPQDAVLSIDLTSDIPMVTEVVPHVAQGLESLAFHPSGDFAVVTCIDGPYVGHLAVIDLTVSPMQLIYYLPMDVIPQGIEFSPDGEMLFVQAIMADHIDVYRVDGKRLIKSSYVLHTGEGPASMALIQR